MSTACVRGNGEAAQCTKAATLATKKDELSQCSTTLVHNLKGIAGPMPEGNCCEGLIKGSISLSMFQPKVLIYLIFIHLVVPSCSTLHTIFLSLFFERELS